MKHSKLLLGIVVIAMAFIAMPVVTQAQEKKPALRLTVEKSHGTVTETYVTARGVKVTVFRVGSEVELIFSMQKRNGVREILSGRFANNEVVEAKDVIYGLRKKLQLPDNYNLQDYFRESLPYLPCEVQNLYNRTLDYQRGG